MSQDFCRIKQALISAPIIQRPGYNLPFEIIYDTSNHAVGPILVQTKDKKPVEIYCASRKLDEAQQNYTTTEKELLVVIYTMKKFTPYLPWLKVIMSIGHAALKHLVERRMPSLTSSDGSYLSLIHI